MDNTINAVGLIKTIANKLRDKKLENIPSVEKEIDALGNYLGVNQMQTIIFVAIFDSTSSGLVNDVDDIAKYFQCSSLEIMEHKKDFDKLLFCGLIEKVKNRMARNVMFTSATFRIPVVIFEAILCDEPLNNVKSTHIQSDHFDFIREIGEWLEYRDSDDISTVTFLAQAKELEENFSSCDFVKEVRCMLSGIEDRVLFYEICKDNFIDGDESDLEDTLKDLFDHRSMVLNEMKNYIKEKSALQKCGLVECRQDDDKYKLKLSKNGYKLLLGEYADVKLKKTTGLDKFEFVKAASDLIKERKKNNYKIYKLESMVYNLETDNRLLPLVKDSKKIIKDIRDRIFFYEMCDDILHSSTYLEPTLGDIYDKQQYIIEESTKWRNEMHPLQTLGIAELGEENFFGNTKVELTDEGRELFLQKDAEKFKKKDSNNEILNVDKIKTKNLYFSSALKKQLDFLSESIQPKTFESLQNRLKEKGLSTGVTAIFYGTSGTGKTESVYQLAKTSGRDVMQVDISEMKTCWYGESQKLVKGVFKKYERLCQRSKQAPILLFNEADAVFGNRMERTSSSADQTDNAIQNIILEQMEKLKGILIATTNLEGNLDAAFERRFLFKIKFEKPSIESKILIWQDKLPQILESDAEALAKEYDFSGGEIDNIVRKVTMNEVLTGSVYSLDYLRELCSQEHLLKKTGIIGFCR